MKGPELKCRLLTAGEERLGVSDTSRQLSFLEMRSNHKPNSEKL